MGGRGANAPGNIGGGGQLPPFNKNALGTRVPADLRDAIGQKGAPLPIDDAMAGANPYYSPFYGEYSLNCQRCVVAYEMRRRGYKVTAMPTFEGDILPYAVRQKDGVTTHSFWMGSFQGAKTTNVGSRRRDETIRNIESQMKQWGSGSRGIIRVSWNNGGGHVFNVENSGGTIRYIDAQTGTRVNIKEYMSMAKPSKTGLVRTDNLKPSNRMKNSVTQER